MQHPLLRTAVRRADDRGFLIATFTVSALNAQGLGVVHGVWEVSDEGAEAGFEVRKADKRWLNAPYRRPEGVIGLEGVGGDGYGSATTGWFDGSNGLIVPISANSRVSMRLRPLARPRSVDIRGADERVNAGAIVRLCAVVR